jgi:stress-induced morphogen
MVEPDVLEARIRTQLSDVQRVEIEDLTGTKDHYRALIVSGAFAGLSRIEQHRAVYGALGELMAGPVHALTLQTFTPDAWNQRGEAK